MTYKSFVKPLKIAWKIDSGFWTLLSIVLKPGPVAGPVKDPGSGFWPGQFFFLKNQNNVVLVKKQKSTGLQPGLASSHRVFSFPFFLQPGPVHVPGRPGPWSTRRAGPGFKTMLEREVRKVKRLCGRHSQRNF